MKPGDEERVEAEGHAELGLFTQHVPDIAGEERQHEEFQDDGIDREKRRQRNEIHPDHCQYSPALPSSRTPRDIANLRSIQRSGHQSCPTPAGDRSPGRPYPWERDTLEPPHRTGTRWGGMAGMDGEVRRIAEASRLSRTAVAARTASAS